MATTVWRSYFDASQRLRALTVYRPAGASTAATHLTRGQPTESLLFGAGLGRPGRPGNAALTWVHRLNGTEHIKAMTREAGQQWGAPAFIAENPGPTTGNFEDYNRPTVAVEDGEMALAYGRSDDTARRAA